MHEACSEKAGNFIRVVRLLIPVERFEINGNVSRLPLLFRHFDGFSMFHLFNGNKRLFTGSVQASARLKTLSNTISGRFSVFRIYILEKCAKRLDKLV